tara:strand:+ start:1069 stop:1239 length:171 start_codon:yes stop_codon:yes gene_type:complete
MKKFRVVITADIQKTFEVMAMSEEDADLKAQGMFDVTWRESDYVSGEETMWIEEVA